MKVLIDPRGNTLHDVVADDAVFPVAPPLRWETAPPGFNPMEWRWDGARFLPIPPTPPAPPNAANARAAARAAIIDRQIQAELAKPASDIPEVEDLRAALR